MELKKQLQFTPKKISSWIATAIITLALVALMLVSLFLYKNFYQTVTQTKEIMLLREKVALDTINLEKFNLIVNKFTEKTKAKSLNGVASPFR